MTIKLEEFNECPGAETVQAYLDETHLSEWLEVADAKQQYYQNTPDTLVLKVISGRSLTFYDGLALGKLQGSMGADEFNHITEDYESFYRVWWD